MPQAQRRDSICIILSALFLDVQLSSSEIYSMAASLYELDASPGLLDDVLYHDLFPILYPNLINVYGIWTAFDADWLLPQIYRRREADLGYVHRFYDYLLWVAFGGFIRQEFDHLKQAVLDGERCQKLRIELHNDLDRPLKQPVDSPQLMNAVLERSVESTGNR